MLKAASLISAVSLLSFIISPTVVSLPAQASEQPGGEKNIGITPTEITVGACASLSGEMKLRGEAVVNGGKAYFNYINKQGGINGRTLKVITCDDKYSPDEATKCFYNCLLKHAFLGTLFQGTIPATQYVLKADTAGIPLVGFSAGAEFIVSPVHKHVFQLRETYQSEAEFQVNTLWNKFNKRKIAIIYWNDAFGAACREGANKALAKLQAKIVTEVAVPRFNNNLTQAMVDLKAAAPDAVILAISGDQLIQVLRRKEAIGKNVQLVAFSSTTDILTKDLGKDANGTLISQVLPIDSDKFPTVKLYQKLTQEAHMEPSNSGLEGFLIALTVTEGLKRAGKDLTREGFIKAMESIHNKDIGLGPNFVLNFTPEDHEGFHGKLMMTKFVNGQIQSLE